MEGFVSVVCTSLAVGLTISSVSKDLRQPEIYSALGLISNRACQQRSDFWSLYKYHNAFNCSQSVVLYYPPRNCI